MDVAAVAMGANLIEKTISMDRTTRGPEHMFSLEPSDMEGFVQTIREIEMAMGSPRRAFPPKEAARRRAHRRSIHLRQDLTAGHQLDIADLDFRRPGHGIPPSETDRVLGRTLSVDKKGGERLEWNDM